MLSVMGGAWVLWGSAPVAAQATASAERSFSSATVAPGGQVTVRIEAVDFGRLGGVIETLPAGFTFVSSADGLAATTDAADGRKRVRGSLFGASPQTVSYVVMASSAAGPHTFEGTFIDEDQVSF